jgi:hypothetical protein
MAGNMKYIILMVPFFLLMLNSCIKENDSKFNHYLTMNGDYSGYTAGTYGTSSTGTLEVSSTSAKFICPSKYVVYKTPAPEEQVIAGTCNRQGSCSFALIKLNKPDGFESLMGTVGQGTAPLMSKNNMEDDLAVNCVSENETNDWLI